MRKKNYEAIIEMMPFIDTNIDLIIAGSSNGNYINELAQIAEKIGIENRVKLIPNISPSEKNWYLNHCSAFLFPSKLEGFGLPPAEAMQCGKTPFIFEATSIPEVVGKAGVYWMSADPESMANKVNQFIIEELDMCTSQKKICLRQADKFCWKQMTHNYLDLFKNLLKDQI